MGDLPEAMVRHIYAEFSKGPRNGSVWVMGLDWYNALRRECGVPGTVLWEPSRAVSEYDTLLGIPVIVSEKNGVPRLVPVEQAGRTGRDLPDGELAYFRIIRRRPYYRI